MAFNFRTDIMDWNGVDPATPTPESNPELFIMSSDLKDVYDVLGNLLIIEDNKKTSALKLNEIVSGSDIAIVTEEDNEILFLNVLGPTTTLNAELASVPPAENWVNTTVPEGGAPAEYIPGLVWNEPTSSYIMNLTPLRVGNINYDQISEPDRYPSMYMAPDVDVVLFGYVQENLDEGALLGTEDIDVILINLGPNAGLFFCISSRVDTILGVLPEGAEITIIRSIYLKPELGIGYDYTWNPEALLNAVATTVPTGIKTNTLRLREVTTGSDVILGTGGGGGTPWLGLVSTPTSLDAELATLPAVEDFVTTVLSEPMDGYRTAIITNPEAELYYIVNMTPLKIGNRSYDRSHVGDEYPLMVIYEDGGPNDGFVLMTETIEAVSKDYIPGDEDLDIILVWSTDVSKGATILIRSSLTDGVVSVLESIPILEVTVIRSIYLNHGSDNNYEWNPSALIGVGGISGDCGLRVSGHAEFERAVKLPVDNTSTSRPTPDGGDYSAVLWNDPNNPTTVVELVVSLPDGYKAYLPLTIVPPA